MQRKHKKHLSIVVGVYVSVLILLIGCTVAYIFSKNQPVTNAEFEKSFVVTTGQTITIQDNDTDVTFKITDIENADNAGCRRDNAYDSPSSGTETGVSLSCFTRVSTLLTVNEQSYKGVALDGGMVDMSFSQNGAYELVPYTIELEREAGGGTQYRATIHRLAHQTVDLNEEFVLKNDEIATLYNESGTGIRISFKTCGMDTSCLDSTTYIHNDYQSSNYISYEKQSQYKAIINSAVAKDGIQIRLVESDDATFAKFVFEKTK